MRGLGGRLCTVFLRLTTVFLDRICCFSRHGFQRPIYPRERRPRRVVWRRGPTKVPAKQRAVGVTLHRLVDASLEFVIISIPLLPGPFVVCTFPLLLHLCAESALVRQSFLVCPRRDQPTSRPGPHRALGMFVTFPHAPSLEKLGVSVSHKLLSYQKAFFQVLVHRLIPATPPPKIAGYNSMARMRTDEG